MSEKNYIPLWEKYSLSIDECAMYFGIGCKTLRQFIAEHDDENFVLMIGSHVRIKRRLFEEYLDLNVSIL
ncbi:MAG: excisionase [Erysipelotrichaceae bacterium]|uniref:excisionase n=1 Tax=Floccifex sp. TaxID=2815810 RepID=UPI002A7653CC|nr:excisionase [Floccifex sp.]MDD7281472.1 excisionase [Erysipelotrichaceae bacterium]MDY2957394.1 excisionase [Floccifex sp.]